MGQRRAGAGALALVLALAGGWGGAGPGLAAGAVLGMEDVSGLGGDIDALLAEAADAGGLVIAKFYADFCGHCKRLKPHFEAAAAAFEDSDPPVTFVEIDVKKDKTLYEELELQGIPRMMVWMGGIPVTEVVNRETEAMIEEIKLLQAKGVQHVSPDVLQEKLSKEGMSAVALFIDSEAEADIESAEEAFFELAEGEYHRKKKLDEVEGYSRISYFLVDEPGLTRSAEIFGVSEPAFAVLKPTLWKSEREEMVTTMPASEFEEGWGAIEAFAMENIAPRVAVLTAENVKHFSSMENTGSKVCKLLITEEGTPAGEDGKHLADGHPEAAEQTPQTLAYAEELRSVAADFKESGIQFWVEIATEAGVEDLGFEDAIQPRFGCVDSKETAAKYRFGGEYSAENITGFLKNMLAGRTEPFFNKLAESSPPKPEGATGSFVLTARDFSKKVLAAPGDTMVIYHRPGCPHCHNFLPQYRRFAKISPELDMYEFDVFGNDLLHGPTYKMIGGGVPKAILYPAGAKNEPQLFTYYGPEDSLDELNDFVATSLGPGKCPSKQALKEAKNEYWEEEAKKKKAGEL